jgi:hypothetical protein
MQPVEKPDTYLALSVWGLIMFWPTAIAAIINSVRVSTLWNAGRYEEAVGASQAAYRWGKKSITLGIVIMAVITIMYLLEFAFLF